VWRSGNSVVRGTILWILSVFPNATEAAFWHVLKACLRGTGISNSLRGTDAL